MSEQAQGVSGLLSLAEDESLIGRDIVVEEAGTYRQGPITAIEITRDDYLNITVGWLAERDPWDTSAPWRLCHPNSFTYGGADGWASASIAGDGKVHISVPMAWSGTIVADGTPPLPKPE